MEDTINNRRTPMSYTGFDGYRPDRLTRDSCGLSVDNDSGDLRLTHVLNDEGCSFAA